MTVLVSSEPHSSEQAFSPQRNTRVRTTSLGTAKEGAFHSLRLRDQVCPIRPDSEVPFNGGLPSVAASPGGGFRPLVHLRAKPFNGGHQPPWRLWPKAGIIDDQPDPFGERWPAKVIRSVGDRRSVVREIEGKWQRSASFRLSDHGKCLPILPTLNPLGSKGASVKRHFANRRPLGAAFLSALLDRDHPLPSIRRREDRRKREGNRPDINSMT